MSFREFPVADAVVRVFDRNPDTDDASDMYVLQVLGISVLVRLRVKGRADQPQMYVHIDNENRDRTELAIEVCNGGDALYSI